MESCIYTLFKPTKILLDQIHESDCLRLFSNTARGKR